MSEDRVKLTIDGRTLEAPKGAMLIKVADEAGIYIPRFCYHHRLKVVANCRMCLVEVEGAPKPAPACATPVSDGMKVQTRSERALDAQRATMEFLLINHPLDCPICDQGGECELQDLAMGFGRGVSRYNEGKRVVADKSLGSLVRPDMTRCIHCTRCIRVFEEVGGRQEMGATGRSEHMKVGTYIERSLDSELSGNIIDVCPVGALNSAPFNMRARGWELLSHQTVGAHDCVGSNLHGHSLRGHFLRVVPRENDAINDCWISDRDRFSYCGLGAPDRALKPMVRKDGKLVEVSWEEAIPAAARLLRDAGADLGTLVSPNATCEEMYLAQKLTRALGSLHIDTRLRQGDFRDDAGDPRYPSLGGAIDSLEQASAILLIGSHLNKDAPILGYRVRRSAMAGAAVLTINPRRFDMAMSVAVEHTVHPDDMVEALAQLAHAVAAKTGAKAPEFLASFKRRDDERIAAIADKLIGDGQPRLLLGQLAIQHPAFADLRRLALLIGKCVEGRVGYVTEGANQAGAYLAGAVPHRGPGGVPVEAGRNARSLFETPLAGYLLLGVEPELDCWDGTAAQVALKQAPVVSLTSFVSPAIREYADCVLPLGAFGETPGSFVNGAGMLQRFDAVSVLPGDARPGWKILRALGGAAEVDHGFEFATFAEAHAQLIDSVGEVNGNEAMAAYGGKWEPTPVEAERPALRAITEVGAYSADALVRRSIPLQETPDAQANARVWLHPDDAESQELTADSEVRVITEQGVLEALLGLDAGVVPGTVWLPSNNVALWTTASLEVVAQAAEA
ncbi:MAG: NADH-quinone oxidoreductase subunit NuoG [Gammaproteobacteria bacterium]